MFGDVRAVAGLPILAVLIGLGLPAAAGAQDEERDGEITETVIEELIVTAQKREQSSQDIGIAITAFSELNRENPGGASNLNLSLGWANTRPRTNPCSGSYNPGSFEKCIPARMTV